MKYFALFLTALMLIYTTNLTFALQDNSDPDTKSDFPESIKVGEKVKFSLRMSNPQDYLISDIAPIVEIMPKDASEFVHVEISPKISTLREGSYEITQGTIYVDKGIPVDRIFVSVSFRGENPYGEQVTLASVSTFNASIKIEESQNDLMPPDYLSDQEYRIFSLTEGAYQYNIPYKISNANINSIIVDCKSTALLVNLDGIGTGSQFTINIPRKLLDSKIGTLDDDFFVLINGTEVEYSEITSDLDSRTLQIPILSSSKVIEIIATSVGMFPEPQPCAVADTNDSPYYDFMTPLQQFMSGIPITEIKCKENLTLLKKTDNDLPICVSIKTGQKLLERKFAQTIAVTGPLESMQKSDSHQREMRILSISPKNVTLPDHPETPWTEIQIKESIGKSKPLEITSPVDGNDTHLAKLTIVEVTIHTRYDDNSTGYNTLIFKYSIENVDKDAFYAMPDFEAHFGNRIYPSQMIGDEFSTLLLPGEKKDSSFAVQIGKGANQILLVIKDPATKQTLWSFPVAWHIPSLKNEGHGVLTQE